MVNSSFEDQYIARIKAILDAESNPLEALHQIEDIDLPDTNESLSPLLQAILSKVQGTLEWEAEHTYDYLTGDALDKQLGAIAKNILADVKHYIDDYEHGNYYHRDYTIDVVYEGREDGWIRTETIAHETTAQSKEEAAAQAKSIIESVPRNLDKPHQYTYKFQSYHISEHIKDNSGNVIEKITLA